jgi:hypothetical protein
MFENSMQTTYYYSYEPIGSFELSQNGSEEHCARRGAAKDSLQFCLRTAKIPAPKGCS